MFTFGRTNEKRRAVGFLKSGADRSVLEGVIDAVHDLLESRLVASEARAILCQALIHGAGGGVWEQTGSWVRRLGEHYPSLLEVWPEVAGHESSKVRIRAAAFLHELPAELRLELGKELLADGSANVRVRAAQSLGRQADGRELVRARTAVEPDAAVQEAMRAALLDPDD